MTTVPEAILDRRSIRRFEDRPVSTADLDRILRLAVAAPSSYNLQPWRIVVVRDAEQRQRLHAACYRQPQIRSAPVTLVFAVSIGQWRQKLPRISKQGVDNGAWPEGNTVAACEMIVGFQESLHQRGLLREYAIKDAMIAATQAALAAQSLGLSSCFMNGWQEAAIKEIIGADDDIAIAVLLPIGYPEETPPNPGRLPLHETVFQERLD
ncbi:MAG: nitroreductase family protein [Planctomycetes bacterium]|nr:nitroreductase family protein [Planctomycetota bacterium]